MAPRGNVGGAVRVRRGGLCAGVLLSVAVLLAACGGSAPTGAVGTTLDAMGGTITLDKIISPANPQVYLPAAAGHELVAAVLTIHNTAPAAKYFNNIYTLSKLIDSQNHSYLARNTRKFPVSDCVGLPLFTVVRPAAAAAGCLVFRLPAGAVPVELKISGAHPADFSIAAQAISRSRPRVVPRYPAAAVRRPTATTLPRTGAGGSEALGTRSTTTTSVVGARGATGATTTAAGGTRPSTTTTVGRAYLPGDRLGLHRHKSANTIPKIKAFSPRGGPVGSAVTIIGHRLWRVTQVDFNGVAGKVTGDTGQKIEVTVPSGASTGRITVVTVGGSAVSPRIFLVS